MSPGDVPRRVGQCDAAVVLVGWTALLMALASHPLAALPTVGFVAIPLAALVGWHGQSHAKRLLNSRVTLGVAIVKGAVVGMGSVAAIFLLSWLVPNAVAAGHYLDDFSPLAFESWTSLARALAGPLAAGAIIGALHGAGLHALNTALVSRWAR